MNILIVDDSALMRGIIRQVIEDNEPGGSFELFEAANGRDALSVVESRAIDFVLLDWNMPVLDGLGFVKEVRGRGLDFPIVMVTAVSDEDKIYQAAKAGVTSYIEKPILGSELWDRIKEYIR